MSHRKHSSLIIKESCFSLISAEGEAYVSNFEFIPSRSESLVRVMTPHFRSATQKF